MLFVTYMNFTWTYNTLPSPEQPSPLQKPRIAKKPVFCNMLAVDQERNSRYNEMIDLVHNLCSENGVLNGWLVFTNFLPILFSSTLIFFPTKLLILKFWILRKMHSIKLRPDMLIFYEYAAEVILTRMKVVTTTTPLPIMDTT